MRKEFAQSIISRLGEASDQIFLTGDLGFMALEEVAEAMGQRFINMGVAEQNMVTVAAALAYDGFIPWIYSISPFITLRPYEQLRNDVCLHQLPVKVVGNGGGYGYGIMGSTHHNLEDIGCMRILPNMKVLVPLVSSDVQEAVDWMLKSPHPNYLRLNLAAIFPASVPAFSTWRKIKDGDGAVVVGTGPVLGNLTKLPERLYHSLEIWALSIFPVTEIPETLIHSVEKKKKMITIEEHAGNGGLNEAIAPLLLQQLSTPVEYVNLFAKGYPSGLYGNQQWHQEENSLAGESLKLQIESVLQ